MANPTNVDVDEQALYEGFESAFDEDQRSLFLSRWAALGIPFTLLLVLSIVALSQSSCRCDRLSGVAYRMSALCGGSLIGSFWLLVSLQLTIFATIVLGLVWACVVIAQIEPVIIGVALLLLTPCAFLLVYAGGYFCGNQWRLTSAEQPSSASASFALRQPPVVAALASGVLFVATLLAFVFTGEPQAQAVAASTTGNSTGNTTSTTSTTTFEYEFSYLSTAWVFLGANVALVCICVHLLTTRVKHFPIDGLLAGVSKTLTIQGGSSSEGGSEGGGPASTAEATNGPSASEWFDHKAPAAQAAAAHWLGWLVYGASVFVLLAFALIVAILGKNTATEGAGMGITTAMALLVLDLAVFMAWAGGMFESPGAVCLVVAATRFLLLSAGSYWLLGNCVAYTVLGVYLARVVSQRYFLNLQAQAGFEKQDGAGQGQETPAAGGASAPVADAKAAPMARQASADDGEDEELGLAETSAAIDLITRPEILLGGLTFVFTALVAGMALLGGTIDSLPTPRVPLVGDSTEPQWVFGLGSLAIVASCIGLFFLLGYLDRNNGRMTSVESQVTGAAFSIGAILLGVMLFLATDSYAVLSSLCFLPSALVLFLAVMGELVHAEFQILQSGGLGWLPCCCARGSYCGYPLAPGEEKASSEDEPSTSGATAPSDDSETPRGGAAAASGAGESPAPAPAAASSGEKDNDNEKDKEGETETSLIDSIKAGMGEAFDPHKAQCLHGNQLRNTAMLAAIGLFIVMLVAFASVVAQGVKPIRWAWYGSSMILSTACIYVGVREYFGTLQLSLQEAVFVIVGLGLHIACHIPTIVAESGADLPNDETNYRFLGLLFALFLFPALWTAGVALYQWYDESWDLPPVMQVFCGKVRPATEEEGDEDADAAGGGSGGSFVMTEEQRRRAAARFVYVGLSLSQLILLGFSVAGIFVFDAVLVTAAITAGYVFMLCVASFIIYVITHRGYVPVVLRYAILVGVFLVVVLSVIIGVARYFAADSVVEFATWISVAWWFVVLLLVASGLLDALRGGLIASADIFEAAEAGTLGNGSVPDPQHLYVSDRELLPIHVPSQDGSRMVLNNWSSIWVIIGCVMAAAWGLGVSFVLSPAYPGAAVAMISIVIGLVFALEVSRVTSDRIDRACAIIDRQAAPSMKRFTKPDTSGEAVAGADAEQGGGKDSNQGAEPLPGSLALREVILRAAKKSLGGARSVLAGGASASSGGAVDASDVAIDIANIVAGADRLIGQAAEPLEGEDAHPAAVAGEQLKAILDSLQGAYSSIGIANRAVGCLLGGEEETESGDSEGDAEASAPAAAPAPGAQDDAETSAPAPAPAPAPAAPVELTEETVKAAKKAIGDICAKYMSSDKAGGSDGAAAPIVSSSEEDGVFEASNPMAAGRSVTPGNLDALASLDISAALQGGDWISAQLSKLAQVIESSSFSGSKPETVVAALEAAADCGLELCRRAAAGEDAMRASVASKIIGSGVSAASLMRRNWVALQEWLQTEGEPEAIEYDLKELVAMVRLSNATRPKNPFEASAQDAVATALRTPASLRRYYRVYIGARRAAEKMAGVRHLQRVFARNRAASDGVRRARQVQDDEARKRRTERLKRQRELMEQRRKRREASGKGKGGGSSGRGGASGGAAGGGGGSSGDSDDAVRRARDAAMKRKKEEEEARRRQKEAEEAARRAKSDEERHKLRDAAEKRRREAEAASRHHQQAEEARKRAEDARRRREAADTERIAKEQSRQALETRLRKAMQDRSKELHSKMERGEEDGGKSRARQKALQLVAQTQSEVSTGKWVDGSFESEQGLGWRGSKLQLKRRAIAEQWHDVSSEIPNAMLFKGKPSAGEVRVGWLSDSWLAAALTVIGRSPKAVCQLFPQHPASDPSVKGQLATEVPLDSKGVYAVLLCLDGEWKPVLVDGLLPVFDPALGFKKINPAFMRSSHRGVMYPSILEKSYAKAMGSYAALEGGQPHDAMADLTGGQAKRFDLVKMQEEIASGALWRDMKEMQGSAVHMACGSPTGTDTPVNKAGIPQGFAFAILDVKEADDGRGNRARLVKIRSPAGAVAWKGKYSNEDHGRWTQRLKTLMQFDPEKAEREETGEFCMAFDDFVQQYDHLYTCRTFSPGRWHIARASSAWIRGSTAGGCPSFPETVASNPQYFLEVTEPCTVHISLRVVNVQSAGGQHAEDEAGIRIGIKLYQKKGKRLSQCFQAEERAATRVFEEGPREVTVSAQLNPEGHPLTLLPCTFYPDSEAAFVLTVASTSPLGNLGPGNTLKLIPKSVGAS